MDAADDVGAGPAEFVAAVGQQTHHDGGIVRADGAQAGDCDAVRVDRVGLVALAGVEDLDPG
jgi:hypothetical protein